MPEKSHPQLIPLSLMLLASIAVLFSVTAKGEQAPAANFAQLIPTLPPEPELSAHTYFVRLVGGNKPMLKKREWKKLAPASLSKLLTAVLAEEYLSPSSTVYFSENSKTPREEGEKMSQIPAGEGLSKEEMLKLLLISSANDAAVALAGQLGGTEFFRELANQKAEALGMRDSNLANPTGLDHSDHYATAEDLAKLAEYIWHTHQNLWEITRNATETVLTGSGALQEIKNTNKLLEEFPAILGGKTGFTDNAKESLIFLYPIRPSGVAIAVILGSDDRFGDGRKIIQWLEKIE